MTNAKLSAAMLYASLGWQVIPLHAPALHAGAITCSCGHDDCPSPAKHPRTERGLKDATADEATIRDWWRRWPGANVGVVTGAVSGFVVLDVDKDSGGFETLAALMGEHGELPETVEAATGGGGLHLVFKHPGRAHVLKNSTGKIGPGLDVRGDGGYIVASPSGHISGGDYAWNVSPESATPSAIPDWLLKRMTERPATPSVPAEDRPRTETGQYWLGKALAKTAQGNRNETGLWLACQLRDAGMTQTEAAAVMRDYASRCPHGDKPYTEGEAVQTLASAYRNPPRAPAKCDRLPIPGRQSKQAPKPPPVDADAAAELEDYTRAIADGRAFNVEFPWRRLTKATQALIPGTVTVVCGDPGVGKTFWVLQCLREWHANGHPTAVFFVEKNRVFHMHRLLAQLEANGHFVDWDWIKTNGETVAEAVQRHRSYLKELGQLIHTPPAERVDLDTMLAWVREQCAHGARIIVIDPISAVSGGKDRFIKDEDFVLGAQAAVTAAGASLVLITHSKKGNRTGSPTGHDVANGAAYFKFCDTLIWLTKHHEPKEVMVSVNSLAPDVKMDLKTFCQIEKARHGRGGGIELGFEFGPDLLYAEQGIVRHD